MKLAIFTDGFLPQVNGVVTHVIETVALLAKQHQIVIIAPQPKHSIDTTLLPKSVKVIYLPSAPLTLYKNFRITMPYDLFLFNQLDKFKPDIVHFHTPFTVSLNGISYAKQHNLPIVGTFHTYFMEPEYMKIVGLDKIGLDKSDRFNKLLWSVSNFFYNKADIVICPSQATKNDLVDHGIKKPIKVISNGISNISRLEKTKDIDFDLPKKYLLYVGRISKEKNIDVIIQAFKKTTISNEIHLVIVGDGPEKSNLELLSKELQIENRIHFLGEIPYDKLKQSNIYQNALCFITASTSETQGITLLEAMSAGLPLIGVNARAIPELISNNGILCEPDDIDGLAKAIKKMVTDEKLRIEFSSQSRELVKNHTIEQTVEKLESIYADLIR